MIEMEEIFIADTYLVSVKNDILNIVVKHDAIVDIEQAIAIIAARKKLQKGKEMLTLLDIRELYSITKEAREYTSGEEVIGLDKAMAILVNSLSTKLLANFFIKFNQPPAPTKMFNSREKALEWLETFR